MIFSFMNKTIQFCCLLAFAVLTVTSCKPDKTPGETVITRETPLTSKMPKPPPINPYETPVKGSFADPTPPPKLPITNFLITHYWVFEYYLHAQEFERGRSNQFRWYKFSPDGTFIAGQWETVLSKGTWKLATGETKNTVIVIDSDNDAEDSQWDMQPNAAGDEMSWSGVRSTTYQGHLVKAINLMTMPTKKQFGQE